MTKLVSAPLTSKAQLTLPKRVRDLLGVREKGDRIGFLIDEKTHRIILTRVAIVPSDEPYTDEEISKLLRLRKEPGSKTFDASEAFLKPLCTL